MSEPEYRIAYRPEHKWHVEWFDDNGAGVDVRCFARYATKHEAEMHADKLRSMSLNAKVYPMWLAQ